MKRRNVLALSGAAGAAVLIPTGGLNAAVALIPTGEVTTIEPPAHQHAHHETGSYGPGLLAQDPFTVQLPIPPVLKPYSTSGGTDRYTLDITPADVEIIPGRLTPLLTYGGGALNPTIKATAGRRVEITYRNRLDQISNVHLHGGHVAAVDDGHPMDVIQPGGERVYHYPNSQRPTTLWYHDHSHHSEAEHVYRGLFGFYLIDGPFERLLGLPEGEYDVPIALRDANIGEDGALIWNPAQPFLRNTLLANGRQQPYFPVAARKYRFRLLNASTHRAFDLSLGGAPIIQVGSDGGLLPAPVTRTSVLMGPAERVDVVVDFSQLPVGTNVVLSDATGGPLIRFDVVRRALDPSRVPPTLRPLPPLPTATKQREMVLSINPATFSGLINGVGFDPARVDSTITEGTTEIWKITNSAAGFPLEHTFHLHLVQFRVLDRDGAPPWTGESGLKDTVFIRPGESVRVQATFSGYLGRYLYHCHMLEHSASGMMAQMEIVAAP